MDKISLCTVCMNRLKHLKQTTRLNITGNLHRPNVEFVILDYNSQDGMEDWAKNNLDYYIKSGLIKYYKTYEPAHFNMSHSKNLVMKLATGNILCMIDADNFAGPNYVDFIDSVFGGNNKNLLLTTLPKNDIPNGNVGGKLSFRSECFASVNGFDESFVGYGMEDIDIINRLEKKDGTRVFVQDEKHLHFIRHSDKERIRNFPLQKNLLSMYVCDQKSSLEQDILYLLKDDSFLKVHYEFEAELKDNPVLTYYGWTIKDDGHQQGIYRKIKGELELKIENGQIVRYHQDENKIISSDSNKTESWTSIEENDELYITLLKAYFECFNRRKYIQNNESNDIINPTGWGKGTVYLNFDTSNPIKIL